MNITIISNQSKKMGEEVVVTSFESLEMSDEVEPVPPPPRQPKEKIYKHSLTPQQLITGFPLHTHRSLELALKAARGPRLECKCTDCVIKHVDYTDICEDTWTHSTASQTMTSFVSEETDTTGLKYLMGLKDNEEEEEEKKEDLSIQFEEFPNYINGSTESMRRAQMYLREHKIFEFFQFLIAHLLAASPLDPINFLINLLDKCLIYRSGISEPPLLYDKRHIECLFNLMDRMRTGYIDLEQYKTGMHTLGIQNFKPDPPMTSNHLVPKHFFQEEAFECLKDILNGMLRKRKIHKKVKKVPKAPPPSLLHIS